MAFCRTLLRLSQRALQPCCSTHCVQECSCGAYVMYTAELLRKAWQQPARSLGVGPECAAASDGGTPRQRSCNSVTPGSLWQRSRHTSRGWWSSSVSQQEHGVLRNMKALACQLHNGLPSQPATHQACPAPWQALKTRIACCHGVIVSVHQQRRGAVHGAGIHVCAAHGARISREPG